MDDPDDNATFDAWMREHRGIVVKVARGFAADGQEFDDVAQDIMVAVWKSVSGFRGDSGVATYIYRVALNCAISRRRSERSRSRHEHPQAEAAATTPSPDHAADQRLELLYAEIRQLGEFDRALTLLHLDGYRYDEIAGILGLSPGNVGVRLTRIRKTLRDNLKDK